MLFIFFLIRSIVPLPYMRSPATYTWMVGSRQQHIICSSIKSTVSYHLSFKAITGLGHILTEIPNLGWPSDGWGAPAIFTNYQTAHREREREREVMGQAWATIPEGTRMGLGPIFDLFKYGSWVEKESNKETNKITKDANHTTQN